MEHEKSLTLNLPIVIPELAQVLVFASVAISSFFLPFAFGHPQWLVGTIVNACLFLGAIYLPKRYCILLAILPSLGVLARGVIFGSLTPFLIYFLPFIWLGNLVLILIFRIAFAKTGFIFSIFLSSAVKYLFLFLTASVYFRLSIVPAVFLQTMGLSQLADALAGGIFAFIIFKALNFYGKPVAGSKRVD